VVGVVGGSGWGDGSGLGVVGGVGVGRLSVVLPLATTAVTTRRATPMAAASRMRPLRLGLGSGGVGLVPQWRVGGVGDVDICSAPLPLEAR
jgi:hypothetical protein